MAQLSIGENEEEAPLSYRRRRFTGPASQSLISVQRSRSWVVTEEDDLIPIKDIESDSHDCEEDEDGEFEVEAVGEDSGNEVSSGGHGEAEGHDQQMTSSRTATSPVFNNPNVEGQTVLTNVDVLDCPFCHVPLFTPIFQCKYGHIACSSCCLKRENVCLCGMPIGNNRNNRCRGLEKFIESISSIACRYVRSGCKKTVPYNKKSEHEQICPRATCTCPYPSCHEAGPSKMIYLHFGVKHAASTTCFTYNTTFPISIEINQKHMFLQEQNERVIFILNHEVHEDGQRSFTIDFVGGLGTFLKGCFLYQLTAKSMDTSLSLQAVPEIYKRRSRDTPRKYYLTLPSGFADYSTGTVSLFVCIKKGIPSDFETEAEAEEEDDDYDDYDYGKASGLLQVVLTDPDVLNCSICLDPLCPHTPVFQCEKGGHIACSSCYSKVKGKCHVCFPIGTGYNYNRCGPLEDVVASIKKLCKYAVYGCKTRYAYNLPLETQHEQTCLFAMYFCPHPSCPFAGRPYDVYPHFRDEHAASITNFTYNSTFSLCVEFNQKYLFLQEPNHGAIFILNHQVLEHGRAFYLDCIGRHILGSYLEYHLTAETMESPRPYLKTAPEMCTNWSQHPPGNNYLTIPPDFVGYNGPLSLSLSICRISSTHRIFYFAKR